MGTPWLNVIAEFQTNAASVSNRQRAYVITGSPIPAIPYRFSVIWRKERKKEKRKEISTAKRTKNSKENPFLCALCVLCG
jgi:hypothetical protein